jgi:hypothetical protein
MPYSKGQLLAFANERASQFGLPPISESVFESWIDDGILAGAVAHGIKRGVKPDWTYREEAKDTVELIVELKSHGAQRTDQLLICLYAFSREIPFHQVKAALKWEFRRITQRQERGRPWWKTHPDDIRNISEIERAKRTDQLPPLDSNLAATPFALSRESALKVLLRGYWGDDAGDQNIFRDLPDEIQAIAKLCSVSISPWNIAGAIGPPEESAAGGYEIIDRITGADLESARGLFCQAFGGLLLIDCVSEFCPDFAKSNIGVAYRKAAGSFLTPDWIVPTMALLAISAFNTRCGVDNQIPDSQGESAPL